jgi:hypothetical protein
MHTHETNDAYHRGRQSRQGEIDALTAQLHVALDAKEKAEADCVELNNNHGCTLDALFNANNRCAELQAIVDRLNPKGATPDYWLRSKGWYEIGTSFGGRAWSSNDKVYAAEPMAMAILYQITRESALSAAASSGAKEKQ